MSINFGFLQINWLVSRLGGLLKRLADTVGPELVPQSSYEPLQYVKTCARSRHHLKYSKAVLQNMAQKPYPPKRMVVGCDLQVFREPFIRTKSSPGVKYLETQASFLKTPMAQGQVLRQDTYLRCHGALAQAPSSGWFP